MTSHSEYRQYLETLGEDVVRHRLANRMPIGDKPENNPSYEFTRAWLIEKARVRGRRESLRFWVILIVAVVSAIAAVIAAVPVLKSWVG
jgi:hypothetical protein